MRIVSDDQALAALAADLRADFAADGVVRYAVAFPASATITLWLSALGGCGSRAENFAGLRRVGGA
jgi:hypothetical protein